MLSSKRLKRGKGNKEEEIDFDELDRMLEIGGDDEEDLDIEDPEDEYKLEGDEDFNLDELDEFVKDYKKNTQVKKSDTKMDEEQVEEVEEEKKKRKKKGKKSGESSSRSKSVNKKKKTAKGKKKKATQDGTKGGKEETKAKKEKKKKGKKKPKAKDKKTKGTNNNKKGGKDSYEEAKKKIGEYMKKTNRPYSYTNIFDNLHKPIAKKKVADILVELAKEGLITEKAYGKTLIYHYNQSHFPEFTDDDLKKLDEEYKAKQEELQILNVKLQEKKNTLNVLKSKPSLDELKAKLAALKSDVSTQQETIDDFKKKNFKPISEEDLNKLEVSKAIYQKEMKRRYKIQREMVGMLAEGMDLKDSEVITKLDLQV